MKKGLYLALIVGVIGLIFFWSRQVFFYQHDPKYFEDWYYHSQWNIPGSTRGMSDGPLYMFVGDRLVAGENPFNINYEIPPLGKNLYGLSAKAFGNPYWLSAAIYLLSVLVFWRITTLLKLPEPLLVTLLFVTTPFISSQIKETMLDLPLMFFYLVHFWFFVRYLEKKDNYPLIFTGIFLGLATATKPGVYTPFVGLLGLLVIYSKYKNFWSLILYTGSVFAGYVLGFFPSYFIRHPNPLPWLRLHERSIQFYLDSGMISDHLAQWKTIFGHLFDSGWWSLGTNKFGDWTIILPLGVVAVSIVLIKSIKKTSSALFYLAGVAGIFLAVNTYLHFFSRYLMPIIPIFVLMIAYLLRKRSYLVMILVILNFIVTYNVFTINKIEGHAEALSRFFSTRANHELYRTISREQRKAMPEAEFVKTLENFFESTGTRDVTSKVLEVSQDKNNAQVKFQFTYLTKYGYLTHEPVISFYKEHNEWKSVWQWSHLWPSYTPDSVINIKAERMSFDKLTSSSGQVIAERSKGLALYKITRVMFNWGKDLDDLAKATGSEPMDMDRRIKTFVPDHNYRFMDYIDPSLSNEDFEKAKSIPGVKLVETEYVNIVDKKSAKSVAQYVRGVRKNWPELFFVRATGSIVNPSGETTPLIFTGTKAEDTVVRLDISGEIKAAKVSSY